MQIFNCGLQHVLWFLHIFACYAISFKLGQTKFPSPREPFTIPHQSNAPFATFEQTFSCVEPFLYPTSNQINCCLQSTIKFIVVSFHLEESAWFIFGSLLNPNLVSPIIIIINLHYRHFMSERSYFIHGPGKFPPLYTVHHSIKQRKNGCPLLVTHRSAKYFSSSSRSKKFVSVCSESWFSAGGRGWVNDWLGGRDPNSCCCGCNPHYTRDREQASLGRI
jgi:hypothetical protein